MEQFNVGDRVEAGAGTEYDSGRIQSISGMQCMIGWDSGVVSPCDLSELRVEGESAIASVGASLEKVARGVDRAPILWWSSGCRSIYAQAMLPQTIVVAFRQTERSIFE